MARPTRCTPERVARICEALRAGTTHRTAAACGGVSRDTFYHWLKTRPDFAAQVATAEAACAVAMVRVIYEAAQRGEWRAALWWLERRRPADWAR